MMTEVAAQVSDGFIFHPFHTIKHMKAVTVPTLQAARTSAGRAMSDFQISGPVFVATGDTDERMESAVDSVREWISFYGSTPAYRPVLETHGWGDLQTDLHVLTKQGRWAEMKALVSDDVLHQFAVVCQPADVAAELVRRYSGLVDRLSFNAPYEADPEYWAATVSEVRRLSAEADARAASSRRPAMPSSG